MYKEVFETDYKFDFLNNVHNFTYITRFYLPVVQIFEARESIVHV